jgi:hypothetical protein
VIVTPDSLNLRSGDSVMLAAAALDASGNILADRPVTWTTSNEGVALVSSVGLVKAVWYADTMPREVLVTATTEGVSGTAFVVVTPAAIATLKVSLDSLYLMVGRAGQLTATVRDAAGRELSARPIAWMSIDSTIARVSNSGLVTGVAAGSVSVWARSEGVADTVSITVGNLFVTIRAPSADMLVPDTVAVRADVASLFQIGTVTATLGATTVPMTFRTQWTATLAIQAEAFGPHQLRVRATDVFDDAHEAVVDVIHDPPPSITIVAPDLGAVASPSLTLVASCSDPNASACQSLTARLTLSTYSPSADGSVLATGTTSLNSTVSLAEYEGRRVFVWVTGVDSAGQATEERRDVWVFSGTGLQRVVTVPGVALDFDGARTFYAVRAGEDRDILRIRTPDGGDTVVFDMAGRTVRSDQAFLMPAGAIFTAVGVTTDVLHEFRDGSLDTLSTGYLSRLAVKDTFAVWLVGLSATTLYLRDLVNGQTTIVANDAAKGEYDVSAVGDVAYWTESYQVVYVPRGGAPLTLTTGPLWNTYPRTDGLNVVYRKTSPCCSDRLYQVYMAPVTGGEIALTSASTAEQTPDRDYAAQGGWVAYTQQSPSGELQVWSRSPAGTTTQVSFFGTSSRIEALDASGTIIFANGTTRYRSSAPYTSVTSLGSDVGEVIVRRGQFVILLGGAVFTVP